MQGGGSGGIWNEEWWPEIAEIEDEGFVMADEERKRMEVR
jgi:hypothetical protein